MTIRKLRARADMRAKGKMALTARDPTQQELAIIVSFRRPDYTVAGMEHEGFTHVGATCPNCGAIVLNPFRMMRSNGHVHDTTTLAEISRAYRCSRSGCGARLPPDAVLQPSYQYMGTPADTRPDSPVNRRVREMPPSCPNCDGTGWVCENHPDRPYKGSTTKRADACECGAGMPCRKCNASSGLDDHPRLPPGFRTTVDKDGDRH